MYNLIIKNVHDVKEALSCKHHCLARGDVQKSSVWPPFNSDLIRVVKRWHETTGWI